MKEVFGFPEIEQFRTAIQNVTNRTRYRGRDEVTNEPIFDGDAVLPVINYRGTVKLHGTNMGVIFEPITDTEYGFYTQSRERIIVPGDDNAGGSACYKH